MLKDHSHKSEVLSQLFGFLGWMPVPQGHVGTLQAGATPHAQQRNGEEVGCDATFEHAQVVLKNI